MFHGNHRRHRVGPGAGSHAGKYPRSASIQVQFGVIMVLNLMIGLLTPPVGMVLFVLSRVARIPFDQTVRAVSPFLIPLVFVLLLITIFPQLTLAVPKYFYR